MPDGQTGRKQKMLAGTGRVASRARDHHRPLRAGHRGG